MHKLLQKVNKRLFLNFCIKSKHKFQLSTHSSGFHFTWSFILNCWLKVFSPISLAEYVSLIPQNACTFVFFKIFKISIMFWFKRYKNFYFDDLTIQQSKSWLIFSKKYGSENVIFTSLDNSFCEIIRNS